MSSKLMIPSRVDPLTSDTIFEFEGAEYRLRFDFRAIYAFFVAAGRNPALEPMGSDPAHWAALHFVGLLCHHPEIKIEQVQGWMASPRAFVAFVELTQAAFVAQLPDPEPDRATGGPPSA